MADGDTITAALFNDEFNRLLTAFSYASSSTTGHRHDGTAGEGGNIHTIGDQDFLNKILTTGNTWEFYVEVSSAAAKQMVLQDGALVPHADSDLDLGTSSKYFKNAYIDSITTTGNVGVGGNLTVTGTTTFNGGTITLGDAAADNVVFGADVNSSVIPNTDDTFDLGSASQQWRNVYVDGTVFADVLDLAGTAITSTAAELNILDGVTSTTAELNILDGVTSTTAELNILDGVTSTFTELNLLDGVTSTTAELNILDGVTSTAAELNILDGVTSTAAELNLLDGVTSTTAELNILDGVTSTAAELNILDGVTSTATELNLLDGVTSTTAELNALDGITAVVGELNALDIGSTAVGTAVASKAVILDSNKDYTGIRNLTISGELDAATLDISGAIDIAGNSVLASVDVTGLATASTFEPDGDTSAGDNAAIGYAAADGLVLTGQGSTGDITIRNDADALVAHVPTGTNGVTFAGDVIVPDGDLILGSTAVTSTAAELNILDGVTATATELNLIDGVTSTTAELNILDGVTSTAAELNILDGVTSTAAELNLVDGAGTLKEVGKETIWVPAAAMYPNTTNGCADIAQVELSNGPELKCLDFATGADDFAQFTVAFPKSWNEGTVTFQAFWTVTGTNTGTVAWALAGGSMANDASINVAFGTAVVATALAHSGTSNDMMVSVESGAVTIANAAVNTVTFFEVFRDVSADNQSGDARLLGIKLFFTTDAANDA